MDLVFGGRLDRFGKLVQDIGRLVHPAPLFLSLGVFLGHRPRPVTIWRRGNTPLRTTAWRSSSLRRSPWTRTNSSTSFSIAFCSMRWAPSRSNCSRLDRPSATAEACVWRETTLLLFMCAFCFGPRGPGLVTFRMHTLPYFPYTTFDYTSRGSNGFCLKI